MILNNDVSDILSNSEAEKLGFRKNVMSDFAMSKSTLLRNAANGKSCYIPHPFADNHKLKSPAIHPAISIYIFIVFSGSSLLVPIREHFSGTHLPLYSVTTFEACSSGRL